MADARKEYTYTVVLIPEEPGYNYGYVVEVPALPGCISQGETVDEALAMIRDAIRVWIESARHWNETVPEDREPTDVEADSQIHRVTVKV